VVPTILLLDDDKDHLVIIERLIKGLKHGRAAAVVSFTSAREALGWCCQRRPDLCLIDYMMPEMDGLTFIAAVRKLPAFQNVPIVMITGTSATEIRDHALARGATDFWTKPVDAMEVRSWLAEFLARSHGAAPYSGSAVLAEPGVGGFH
jgi:CheY-like chemotaxis protein